MIRFIVRRILWLVPVLLFVSLITFTLMHVTPGGPWDKDKPVSATVQANLNAKYNLDKPIWQQYLLYMNGVLHGDLGPSYTYQDRSVTSIILEGLPTTASLGGLAATLAVIVGVPLGILAATRQNTPLDYTALGFGTIFASVPSFVLGFVLIIVFALDLHAVPTSGWGKPAQYVLPVLTLGLNQAALLTRITRASVLDVNRQDFMRTARAKGMREALVVQRHLLKNALIPIVTVLGPILAVLLVGSLIVETIFSIPGIGRLLVQGITQRDYSLIMGTTLLYAFVIALLNLIVDVLYGFIDPRITYR
ncbi:MAG: ABC transporter permease [Chloroflexi bacterium]|nr:ABC transporter permease [Chloroflexota bacterium]MBV9894538.1 ABC transporter permease [Chloroflexota bacterium]